MKKTFFHRFIILLLILPTIFGGNALAKSTPTFDIFGEIFIEYLGICLESENIMTISNTRESVGLMTDKTVIAVRMEKNVSIPRVVGVAIIAGISDYEKPEDCLSAIISETFFVCRALYQLKRPGIEEINAFSQPFISPEIMDAIINEKNVYSSDFQYGDCQFSFSIDFEGDNMLVSITPAQTTKATKDKKVSAF